MKLLRSVSLFGLLLLVTIADCRYGYHYYEDVGWLKYYRVPDTFPAAYLRCMAEGAIVASPTNSSIKDAMVTMNKVNGDDACGYFTGIHAMFSRGDFSTMDGIPLHKISVDWAPDEPFNAKEDDRCTVMLQNGTLATAQCNETFPYICHRMNYSGDKREPCGTADKLYWYDKRTRSCYKFHSFGLTWRQAYMTCMAEGGYLAIINDATEAEVIKNTFAKYPAGAMVNSNLKDVAAVGFLEMGQKNWVTIHGQPLSKVYSKFDANQPDHDTQKCGGVFRNGNLDNIDCEVRTMPFICEKHPDSLKL